MHALPHTQDAEEEERKRFIQQVQLQGTKEALYPRPAKDASRLKKIESGQAWEGTASFYEGWRYEITQLLLLEAAATWVVPRCARPLTVCF